MKNYLVIAFMGLGLATLSGCATNKTQYYWGEYENLVYQTHIAPEEAQPIIQIEKLQVDIQKAEAANKPIPPGLYAHLGLMYAANGDKSLALDSLNKEKELFPESTQFIDGLIDRSVNNK
jgi:hypothetical protein